MARIRVYRNAQRWVADIVGEDRGEIEYSDHRTWDSAMETADEWARGVF